MRFRSLDGFRGLAALIVCLYHFPVASHVSGPPFFLANAQMLMDFFFVMSGFIIAGAYGDRIKTVGDLTTFAVRRFGRLWPLHAVVLAAFVAIEAGKALLAPHLALVPPFSGPRTPDAILTNLLLIHSLHVHPTLTWNAPSWTVSVEFWTYLVFAGLTLVFSRRPVLAAAVMAAVGAIGVGFIAHKLDANYDWGLFRCFFGFFCGVLTWKVWRARPLTLSGPAATAMEVATTVATFAYMIGLGGTLYGPAPFGMAGPVVFAAFIWVYASDRGGVTRLMRAAPCVRLGEISYSIYLLHFLIVALMGIGLTGFGHVLHIRFADLGFTGVEDKQIIHGPSLWLMDLWAIGYLAVVVGVSSLTFEYIEEPARKWFQRFGSKRPRVAGEQRAAPGAPALAGSR